MLIAYRDACQSSVQAIWGPWIGPRSPWQNSAGRKLCRRNKEVNATGLNIRRSEDRRPEIQSAQEFYKNAVGTSVEPNCVLLYWAPSILSD
jgi:hypothetical protein